MSLRMHRLRSAMWWSLMLVLSAAACASGRPAATSPTGRTAAWSCPDDAVARTRDTVRGAEVWCEDRAGHRHGPYQWVYRDGITAQQSRYVDGELDGPFLSWHPDASRRGEGRFAAGKRVGRWREWHANGKLWLDASYAQGTPEGRWLEYDATGTPMFEGTYRAGRLEGEWHAYRPGAKELSTGTSSRGRLDGLVRYAERDGGGRWERRYAANRPHGTWRYFIEGYQVFEMTYRDGLLDGPMIQYGWTGIVSSVQVYRQGELVTAAPDADESGHD